MNIKNIVAVTAAAVISLSAVPAMAKTVKVTMHAMEDHMKTRIT